MWDPAVYEKKNISIVDVPVDKAVGADEVVKWKQTTLINCVLAFASNVFASKNRKLISEKELNFLPSQRKRNIIYFEDFNRQERGEIHSKRIKIDATQSQAPLASRVSSWKAVE